MSTKPHDALVRSTFSQPEHASGELQHLLPPALSALIDWSTLAVAPGSFVDEALQDSQSDLLFTVRLGDRSSFLYLLFEHQSTPDRLLVFRDLKYAVRIWDGWLKDHPHATKLPVVIPILLCHGPTGWSAATSFEDLLDVDSTMLSLVRDFVPKFRVLVDDLSVESDEALRSRAMTDLARIVLWCLKTARSTDALIAGIPAWVALFRRVSAAPNGRAAIAVIWRYLWTVHDQPEQRVLPALAAALDQEQKEDMASIADQLIEKGVQKGERAILLRQLRRRFGELPDEAAQRIERATREELELWSDRVLTAATLAEVLEQPQ